MNNYTQGLDARRKALLDKYYAAETSAEEELELYALLLDVQEGDEYYADAILLRSQFEIEYMPELSIAQQTHKDKRWIWGLSLAASVLLACWGIWFYHQNHAEPMLAIHNNQPMTQEEVDVVVNDAVLHVIDAFTKANRTNEIALGVLRESYSQKP